MLELTVKTLDSQNHSFTVPDETTVRQLKENILEKMEVPVEIQRLIFHGKVLQDEKKLTDYGDVNGKVIHLVQRPPPPPTRGSNNSASDSNLRSNIRRTLFGHRDRFEGSNTTYLGAMAFPTDLMEAQGMMHPLPSQGLSRTRLFVAKRMLNRAASSISALENDGQTSNSEQDNQDNGESLNPQGSATNGNGPDEVREETAVLGAATDSIAQVAQAASVALAAAVSAAEAAGVPHITIRDASGQSSSMPPTTEPANNNLDEVNLFMDDNHPEDVAAEVEIGGNNDTNTQDRQESDSAANSLEGTSSAPSVGNMPRRTVERTSAFAALLNQLDENHRRFQPLLRRCQQLMVEDPSFNENSSPNAEECQRLFNGVSETMHHLAHAYHALSDIMVDFNEDTPRALRCRPVIIQHTAILDTGYPIQAQINLSARRPQNGSSSNLSTNDSNQQTGEGNSFPSQVEGTGAAPPSSTAVANLRNSSEMTQERSENENVTPQASASSFGSAATPQQSDSRSTSSQGGTSNNTSGFFLSGPGNVEIYMDFGPQGVTLGSLETTIFRGSEARNARQNLGGGIQLQQANLGPGRPTIELLQSLEAAANQLQNHLYGRANQASQVEQPPPPYEANFQQAVSSGEGGATSNHTVSTQARSSSSTESTNTTPTIPTPRHQIHMGPMNPGIVVSSYDPYLPCNSHHVRAPQRAQNSQAMTRIANAAPNASTTAVLNSSASANVSAATSESERPSNTHSEGGAPTGNVLIDSHMAIMSRFLNAQRLGFNRGQARPESATGETLFNSPPEWVVQRLYPQTSHGDPALNEPQRNVTMTALPNSILGWRFTSQGQSASSNRTPLENLRRNGRDAIIIERNDLEPSSTIFDFLSSISDTSIVEGESIVTDFFVFLATNLTWQDVIELSSMTRRTMFESLITRLQPALQSFVVLTLLQGEAPSRESIARGCERLYSEMRPYIELMREVNLRESVDLIATINNFNQSQLPEIIALIVEPVRGQPNVFAQNVTRRIRNYMRQLVAIIIHCCQDGNQALDTIIQNCVRLLTRGVPEELQQWTEVNTVNNLRSYTANLNVPLEDIQRFLVYRSPGATAQRESVPPEPVHEPMETDSPSTDGIWTPPESIASPDKVEENMNDGLVTVDNESLPDVLIGSETWHNALPSEWVPIITRDTQRQRRQSSQKPFSDAYLSSLPAKRRKLIASAKPQGNLSQVISDGVRQAITAAGINSPVAEKVIAEAGKDDALQAAYKEQERVCVSADLKKNPDFSPSRFPNAFKYFDK